MFFETKRVSPLSPSPSRGNEIGRRQVLYHVQPTRLSQTISFLHLERVFILPLAPLLLVLLVSTAPSRDNEMLLARLFYRGRHRSREGEPLPRVVIFEEIFKFILTRIDGKQGVERNYRRRIDHKFNSGREGWNEGCNFESIRILGIVRRQ